MGGDPRPRPGVGMLAFGAMVVGLSVARLASGWNPGPGWLWFEFAHIAFGVALIWWGGSRLRCAKAARPDLGWWRYLSSDLIAFSIVAAALAGWLAMEQDDRDDLLAGLLELANLWSIARGRP